MPWQLMEEKDREESKMTQKFQARMICKDRDIITETENSGGRG